MSQSLSKPTWMNITYNSSSTVWIQTKSLLPHCPNKNYIADWLNAVDNGQMKEALFLDFRKAFDVLDHLILHEKLKLYKFSCPTLAWFKSYLGVGWVGVRTQQDCISNITSQPQTTTSGVSQGSVLGPLLFILYINDLPVHVNTQTDIFADDATLSSIGKLVQELNTLL